MSNGGFVISATAIGMGVFLGLKVTGVGIGAYAGYKSEFNRELFTFRIICVGIIVLRNMIEYIAYRKKIIGK